ncbi:PASTA domain-containing protein [Phytohabitans kaempferiae]|uniref:PASTA domain-containing protein n=1 Tax=Phytohabitans kaempferiae TaxID=1620943 RepID=A0ABV6MEK4_9ACTN
MADDRDPDDPTSGSTGGAGDGTPRREPDGSARQELDQTGEFDPFADDDAPSRDGAATAAGGSAPEPGAGDEPTPPESDRTAPLPPPVDATRQMPAVDETAPASQSPVWSGRAGVPPPHASVPRGPDAGEPPPPEDSGGPWWMPIVLGIVALLLAGGLIVGIWLIVNADNEQTGPTPTPSPTLAPTSAPATSVAPTTSSPAPPTTAPAGVPVPRLVGLTDQAAREALEELGLDYQLVYRPAGEEPGTVIESDPAEGETVPDGGVVTLVIASPLTPTTPPTSASTPRVEPTPTS